MLAFSGKLKKKKTRTVKDGYYEKQVWCHMEIFMLNFALSESNLFLTDVGVRRDVKKFGEYGCIYSMASVDQNSRFLLKTPQRVGVACVRLANSTRA